MNIVQSETPVDALQGIGSGGVVLDGLAEIIAAVTSAQIVASPKKETIFVGQIYVESTDHIVKSVAFPVGIGKIVCLAVGVARLIGQHVAL